MGTSALLVGGICAAVVVVAIVVVRYLKGRGKARVASAPVIPNDPTPRQILAALGQLEIGHQISYLTIRWSITGVVHYDQDGYRWMEFRLHRDGEWAWLSVDAKAEPPVHLFKAGGGTPQEPGADTIIDDGVTFLFRERGTARFRSEGHTDMADRGTLEFVDYHIKAGRRVMSFERYGSGSWEVTKGEAVELPYISISTVATDDTGWQ